MAIKIILKPKGKKADKQNAMLKAEVDILTKADHPNVYACAPARPTSSQLSRMGDSAPAAPGLSNFHSPWSWRCVS